MEEYTFAQQLWYYRMSIFNFLFALYVLMQLIQLIWDIRKDLKCHECIKSGKCSNNAGVGGSGSRISLLIKDSIVNSRVITRYTKGGDRDG